jgi:transcriptional regulator with XRE-family HTH domain
LDRGLIESLKELRRERERQGLSLSDVADRTGIDRATISKLENAKIINPTIGTLRTYARALGGELAWKLELVRRVAPPPVPEHQNEGTKRGFVAARASNPLCRPSPVDDHQRVAMNKPRFSLEEVCASVAGLLGSRVTTLTGKSSHRIVSVDPAKMEYEIEYASGNRVLVRLRDLYALYRELYTRGSIDRSYVSKNVKSILGWKTWHVPGCALLAILPHVDNSIRRDRGALCLGIQSRISSETTC